MLKLDNPFWDELFSLNIITLWHTSTLASKFIHQVFGAVVKDCWFIPAKQPQRCLEY